MNDINSTPKWLKDLQENSWELELLISGGAIFALFQISDIWITWLGNTLVISHLPGRALFLLLGTFGIETLKLGFILHLILRAFWLSMVCLNYVFPQGINQNKIQWKKPFKTNYQNNEDLKDLIIKIDKLCGIVMYMSIISTFLLVGIIFTIFVFISLPIFYDINTGIFEVVFLFLFLIYLTDLIFSGLLRKIPYLSYLFYPFFIFFDFVTFRKFYQKAAVLFYSNVSKLKFYLFGFLFLSIPITLSYLDAYKTLHWPNLFDQRAYRWQMTGQAEKINYKYYKDELNEGENSPFYIQSKIIKENHLVLFIQYRLMFDDFLYDLDNENKFISDIFEISINDSVYNDIEWFSTYNESTINTGITSVIPIKDLSYGKHTLKISCSNLIRSKANKIENFNEKCKDYFIPFWKDSE